MMRKNFMRGSFVTVRDGTLAHEVLRRFYGALQMAEMCV